MFLMDVYNDHEQKSIATEKTYELNSNLENEMSYLEYPFIT